MSYNIGKLLDTKTGGMDSQEYIASYRQAIMGRRFGDFAARIYSEIDKLPAESDVAVEMGVDAVSLFFSKMHGAGVSAITAANIVDKTLERDIEYAKVHQAELAVVAAMSTSEDSTVSGVTTASSRSSRRAVRKIEFLQKCDDKADVDGFSYLNLIHRARRLEVAALVGPHPNLDRFLSISSKEFDWEAAKKCGFDVRGNRVQVRYGMDVSAYDTIRRSLACYGKKGLELRTVVGLLSPDEGQILPYFSVIGEIFQDDRDMGSASCDSKSDKMAYAKEPVDGFCDIGRPVAKLKLDVGNVNGFGCQPKLIVEKVQFVRNDETVVSLNTGVKHVTGRQSVEWKVGSQLLRVPAVEYTTSMDERVVMILKPGMHLEYGGAYVGSTTEQVCVAIPGGTQVWVFSESDLLSRVSSITGISVCEPHDFQAFGNDMWLSRYCGTSEERFAANSTVFVHNVSSSAGLSGREADIGRWDVVTDPFDVHAATRDYRITCDVSSETVMRPACPVGAPVCRTDRVLSRSGDDIWLSFQGVVALVEDGSSVAWNTGQVEALFSVQGFCNDVVSYHVSALADAYTFDCITASTEGDPFRFSM